MDEVTATAAKASMSKLIDEAATSHEPVLLSEDGWLGVKGMRESVLEGLAAPLDECSEEPGW
ncbi:antitoxin, Phd family [Citrifermentans bemidjiense Bem]|uniref:Antitoxin, Phd family n=1 Tax=Citrifermentans bemidjiense (strain ATCC BAA-1014 / DSM 16622 / JCM 12645 / Bem) TaxID=404380 RepID=B5EAC9_CITBB|nr:type II toxin-antitoxin system Phd/YefM family antitoxin [Citrifermentans bemidjiense]ACH40268.1 antitoxin, Phd family [Citrifermentans bemidjiense Bem]